MGKDAKGDDKKRRQGEVLSGTSRRLFLPGKPAGRGHAELPRESRPERACRLIPGDVIGTG